MRSPPRSSSLDLYGSFEEVQRLQLLEGLRNVVDATEKDRSPTRPLVSPSWNLWDWRAFESIPHWLPIKGKFPLIKKYIYILPMCLGSPTSEWLMWRYTPSRLRESAVRKSMPPIYLSTFSSDLAWCLSVYSNPNINDPDWSSPGEGSYTFRCNMGSDNYLFL